MGLGGECSLNGHFDMILMSSLAAGRRSWPSA